MSSRDTIRIRGRRAELEKAGLCIDCGLEPRRETSKRGVVCGARANARQREYLKNLDPVDIQHADGEMTFAEIGKVLNLSRERTRHIYLRALVKIRKECKRLGIEYTDVVGKGFSMLATAEKWA